MTPSKILDLGVSEFCIDWLKAGRLMKKADRGDKKAKEELERMEASKMVVPKRR